METGDTLHIILMIILTPISVGAMYLVTRWFVTQKSETEQADRVDKIWAQRDDWGEAICRQLIDRKIAPGMTPAMVRLAWGEPEAINRRSDAVEEWLYQGSGRHAPQQATIRFQEAQVVEKKGERPGDGGLISDPWTVIALSVGLAVALSIISLVVIFTVR